MTDISNFINQKINEAFKLFVELLLNQFLMLSVFIFSTFLIFISQINVQLSKVISEYFHILLFLSFVSGVILLAMIIRNLYLRYLIKKYLRNLSQLEKEVLREFVNKREKVLYFPMKYEGIMSLHENMIITMSNVAGLTGGRINHDTLEEERPFSLDRKAAVILIKNRQFLE